VERERLGGSGPRRTARAIFLGKPARTRVVYAATGEGLSASAISSRVGTRASGAPGPSFPSRRRPPRQISSVFKANRAIEAHRPSGVVCILRASGVRPRMARPRVLLADLARGLTGGRREPHRGRVPTDGAAQRLDGLLVLGSPMKRRGKTRSGSTRSSSDQRAEMLRARERKSSLTCEALSSAGSPGGSESRDGSHERQDRHLRWDAVDASTNTRWTRGARRVDRGVGSPWAGPIDELATSVTGSPRSATC
jgi:hypothetical protein